MSGLRQRMLITLLCGGLLNAAAQNVYRYSGKDSSLDGRWKWEMSEASRSGAEEFWVGYSIKRLMDEDSYVLSGNVFTGTVRSRTSLYAILAGKKSDGSSDDWNSLGDRRAKIFKVMKDVALLFRISSKATGAAAFQKVEVANMELSVDLKNKPLYWLGGATDEESVRRLEEVYGLVASVDLKKQLVEGIGIHQRSGRVYPILSKILTGEDPDDVRAKAAFWMAEQNHPEGLNVLMSVAQKDRVLKVREQAVFAISIIESDESTEALITLALKANDSKVRAKAAFWLGNKASQKAISALENIVSDDDETDVQRQALYALSRIKDEEGVDRLIRIAKTHRNPRIRKQAVQLLGQSEDPKALEALIEIVRK